MKLRPKNSPNVLIGRPRTSISGSTARSLRGAPTREPLVGDPLQSPKVVLAAPQAALERRRQQGLRLPGIRAGGDRPVAALDPVAQPRHLTGGQIRAVAHDHEPVSEDVAEIGL